MLGRERFGDFSEAKMSNPGQKWRRITGGTVILSVDNLIGFASMRLIRR